MGYRLYGMPCVLVESNLSNFNPKKDLLLFLDSAKTGLLKNVQKHFLRCFRSREMSKTKVGTFFKHPVGLTPDQIQSLGKRNISNLVLFDN